MTIALDLPRPATAPSSDAVDAGTSAVGGAAVSATRRARYTELAKMWGLTLIYLTDEVIDTDLVSSMDPRVMLELGVLPVREQDGVVVVATCQPPTPERERGLRSLLTDPGAEIRWVATTDWDVRYAVREHCAERLLTDATSALATSRPDMSARTVVTRPQKFISAAFVIGLLVAFALQPTTTMLVLLVSANVVFAVAVAFKVLMAFVALVASPTGRPTEDDDPPIADSDLPVYTILVPAYREAAVIGDLLVNIAALDYPRDKLEVILLVELDDRETLAAAKAAAPPDLFRFVVVPPGPPQTKPKACNVGLVFATGEFVTIYDAEDRPEPDQLRKAVARFRRDGPDLAVLQAALNYFNADDNLLTRLFTLEYTTWFDLMLPGMDRLRLTIPLGGTSNHFRRDVLREMGGWDPYNVTEDADLGVRASALGYRVAVLDSTTMEEANLAVGNWIRQRSRWIKGYMQTSLVHARHPRQLVRNAGPAGAASFVLLVAGTPAAFLAAPILWCVAIVERLTPMSVFGVDRTPWLGTFTVANLVISSAAAVLVAAISAVRRRWWRLAPFALLVPFYWVLHSIAAYKGAWQLVRNPFYWEKTDHGLTSGSSARSTTGGSGGPGAHASGIVSGRGAHGAGRHRQTTVISSSAITPSTMR